MRSLPPPPKKLRCPANSPTPGFCVFYATCSLNYNMGEFVGRLTTTARASGLSHLMPLVSALAMHVACMHSGLSLWHSGWIV